MIISQREPHVYRSSGLKLDANILLSRAIFSIVIPMSVSYLRRPTEVAEIKKILSWINVNCNFPHHIQWATENAWWIGFDFNEDAMLFKLRWLS